MKKIKKAIPIILSFLLLSSCSSRERSYGYRQITMDEAVVLMKEKENYIILDVRTKEEFDGGHIPGAINIANEEIGTEEINELPNKNQLILASLLRLPLRQ